jgi:hypothetical protein
VHLQALVGSKDTMHASGFKKKFALEIIFHIEEDRACLSRTVFSSSDEEIFHLCEESAGLFAMYGGVNILMKLLNRV